MIPTNTKLWAAVQVADPKWETPEQIMQVPETVMLFEKKNDLLMELKRWHYLVVDDEVYNAVEIPSKKTLVAHIRQVCLTY